MIRLTRLHGTGRQRARSMFDQKRLVEADGGWLEYVVEPRPTTTALSVQRKESLPAGFEFDRPQR